MASPQIWYSAAGGRGLAVTACAALLAAASPAPDPLAGTSWRLRTLDGGTAPTGGRPLSIQFDRQGRLSGQDGCNGFWGRYRLEGGRISIELEGETTMSCRVAGDPLLHARGEAMKSLLRRAEHVQIREGVLHLEEPRGQSGAFERAPAEVPHE
jgi:heat shock protein HslJ